MARAKGGRRETYEEAATRLWDNIILREVQDSQFAQYDSKQSMLDDFRSILWGNKAKAKGRSPPPFNSGFNVLIDHIESKAFDEKKNLLKFEDVYPDARRFRLAEDEYEKKYRKTLKERLSRKKAKGETAIQKARVNLLKLTLKAQQKRKKQFEKETKIRKSARTEFMKRRYGVGKRVTRGTPRSISKTEYQKPVLGTRGPKGVTGFAAQLKNTRRMQTKRKMPGMLKNARTAERTQITKQLRARPNRPTVLKRKTKLTATSQLMHELKRLENRKSRRKPLSVYKR